MWNIQTKWKDYSFTLLASSVNQIFTGQNFSNLSFDHLIGVYWVTSTRHLLNILPWLWYVNQTKLVFLSNEMAFRPYNTQRMQVGIIINAFSLLQFTTFYAQSFEAGKNCLTFEDWIWNIQPTSRSEKLIIMKCTLYVKELSVNNLLSTCVLLT